MINRMFNTGIFPDKLKQSKSKLYEYAISNQLTKYLIDNILFSSNQYGFLDKANSLSCLTDRK